MLQNPRSLLLVNVLIILLQCQGLTGNAQVTPWETIVSLGGSLDRDKEGHIVSVTFPSLSGIVGGDFRKIADLPHLTDLAISWQGPLLPDFKVMAAYPQLRYVQVDHCATLKNDELQVLLTNKKIKTLILDGGAFDDEGLRGIAELRELDALWLCKTKVTSKGAIAISACHSLTSLNLSSTQIDDTAIPNLSEMPRLTSLHLHSTNLSDSAVKRLGTMKELRVLDLNRTRITRHGLEELRLLIPDCKVYGGK